MRRRAWYKVGPRPARPYWASRLREWTLRSVEGTMCGICGVLKFANSAPPDPAELDRMNLTLAHRGPDDTGVLLRGQAGLAMRRLSIIDLQTGHQPMTSESGDVAIVFNGEI